MTERSSKRRKIDHNEGPTTAPESSLIASDATASHGKPRTRTPATRKKEARGIASIHSAEDGHLDTPAATLHQGAELPNNDEDDDVIVVIRRPAGQIVKQSEAPDTPASVEDTSVRASGRKRKPPAKLKESATPVVKATKSRARRPMKAKHNQETSVTLEEAEDMLPSSEKGVLAVGKENEAPTNSVSDTESITELAMLRAQMALELHKELRAPSPPSENVILPEHDQRTTLDPDTARPWTAEVLFEIQHTLLSQITSSTSSPVGLEEEYQNVQEIVNQAVETGESNSMILIGSRGSGKTMLVNHVLQAQRDRYPDDFHVVRLNGFIHTDDKLAIRDIWRQLGRDMEPDVNDDTIHSYADTLAMLLALLSDPEELGQSTRTGHMAKSVVFILDELDLFATHPRQTLLYNLFDIAQSRKAPIAVLGLTTRVDIVEALEKRVKSRFSHRYVHFGLPKSLSMFKEICASFLTLQVDHTMAAMWLEVVAGLQAHERYHQHVSKIYYRSKSIPDFLTTLLLPLASLQTQFPMASQEIIELVAGALSTAILGPDSKLELLPSLSSLQLALLICAARQSAIYNTDNVTFNLIYEEYKSLAGKAKLQATASGAIAAGGRVLGKDVAKIAWHELIDVGFVLEDGRGFGKVDIALEEIAGSGADLGQWSRWCKEI